jgi:hypothetical protein
MQTPVVHMNEEDAVEPRIADQLAIDRIARQCPQSLTRDFRPVTIGQRKCWPGRCENVLAGSGRDQKILVFNMDT